METTHRTRRSLLDRIDAGISSGIKWSARRQHGDGYWVGHLQSNSCMEAQWILALHVMGRRDHPQIPGMLRSLWHEQREDGSWGIYYNAPAGDINTTVECYAALRCMGTPADDPRLTKTAAWILEKGGLRHVRVFTKYWLALIGEWPWKNTPNLPPEVIHFPLWFPFNIYNFAQWARATLMPLAILSARRPVVPLPEGGRLDALFPGGRRTFDYSYPKKTKLLSWDAFFLGADRVLHTLQSWGFPPLREGAIKKALEWIIKHQDADGVWGGIQPPWIYSLMALHHEGYPHAHPVMAKGLGALEDPRWAYEKNGATYVQACVSPVWDTVLTLLAYQDTDQERPGEIYRAVEWVLAQEVRTRGDWAMKLPDVEPGGWAFEYANACYPDLDDTAVALMVLAPYRDDPKWRARGIHGAIERALNWTIAMQCRDGGWGAFDKDNDKTILTKIPFCDFGEALDPPSVDVTAHVMEAFARLGFDATHPAMARAITWLKSEQEPDGSWWGRWGVNYVYGTGAVLPALEAIGEDMSQPYIQRAADWLTKHQNPDGGWGETCGSYMDARLAGQGASTASQTAWAVMGLVAAGRTADLGSLEKGLTFLVDRQTMGSWDEPEFTGTGFPGYGLGARINLDRKGLDEDLYQSTELSRGFMINYNLYRHYFPLMAMGRARHMLRRLDNQPVT
ncbi:MAG: squalene--hopene cyclase [Alphaproteobacteria bacterium]